MTNSTDPDQWLLQKPTDLDLHCLVRQGMSCSAKEGLRVNRYIFRGGNSVKTVCLPSEKWFNLKAKNLLRAKLFHLEKTPFQKEHGVQ